MARRHCERSEANQVFDFPQGQKPGLLRCARNDGAHGANVFSR